jgi:hypothetical protein
MGTSKMWISFGGAIIIPIMFWLAQTSKILSAIATLTNGK